MKFAAYEIVRVTGSHVLADALRHRDATTTWPGYYLLLWPRASARPGMPPLRLGPFRSGAEAQMLATSAGALGLIEPPAPVLRPRPAVPAPVATLHAAGIAAAV